MSATGANPFKNYAGGQKNLEQQRRHLKKRQLSLLRTVEIAWRNLRVRLGRSLLVASGIVLALAFLSYILCAEALKQNIRTHASPQLLEQYQKSGVLTATEDADARIQMWWVVGLAMLVSFVGILNAMLLSVTERYGEIGTMKCLGALDRLVVELFLLERLELGVVGTLAGLCVGILMTLLEGWGMYGNAMWRLLPRQDFVTLAGISFLAGLGLTIMGALYPAWRAAKMQPIEAMRSQV